MDNPQPKLAKLVLSLPKGGKREFVLPNTTVTLGRETTNDILLYDPKVSRVHTRIDFSGKNYILIDLGSANGSRVNGSRVKQAVLKPGDEIQLGDSTLRFELAAEVSEAEVTKIISETELETMLTTATMEMQLNDNNTPRIAVHQTGKTWEVPFLSSQLMIGRAAGSDILIDDPKVSRQHACVERRGESFFIRDLGSSNGTFLGPQKIEEYKLQDSDTVRIGDALLVFKRGFTADDLALADGPSSRKRKLKCPVVFVPGFLGSELWRGSEKIWPNARRLISQPEVYRLPDEEPTEVGGLVNEIVIIPNLLKLDQYNRLTDYLREELNYENGRDLLEFSWDWRQDIRLASQRLCEAIEQWDVTPPITLIAHSAGSLVCRYYVERLGGKRKVGRLIMVGGPHLGSPRSLLNLLCKPDRGLFVLLGEGGRQTLLTFPLMYQLLPSYECVVDERGKWVNLLSDETWLPESCRPLLRMARQFRRELGRSVSVPSVTIFGYGIKTITGLSVRRDTNGIYQFVDSVLENIGDDTVPEVSAVIDTCEIHPVKQHHGMLFTDNDVKMRLKLELTRGKLMGTD